MPVTGFDHVAIPTAKPEDMLRFYRALGFQAPTPEEWRASGARHFAIQFGENKINVHSPQLWQDPAFTLRGPAASPGCGDFCFVWAGTVAELEQTLHTVGAAVEIGPVERVGARDGGRARGTSTYTRDPDNNLLEFIVYDAAPASRR
jgi:catechol 2,3-dioxygenase-like lactoylglutathione lyase family enzyme